MNVFKKFNPSIAGSLYESDCILNVALHFKRQSVKANDFAQLIYLHVLTSEDTCQT